MSFYKPLFESDDGTANAIFAAKQKQYTNTSKKIMYFALIGGVLLSVVTYSYFGETVSSICSLVSIVWYTLGYFYCETLWAKEKDTFDFYRTMEKYEKKRPK